MMRKTRTNNAAKDQLLTKEIRLHNLWNRLFSTLAPNRSGTHIGCQELRNLPIHDRADFVIQTWGGAALEKTINVLEHIAIIEREIAK